LAKYELIELEENTWMIPSPANIGLYVVDGKVSLIDSGNDKEAGKQILKLIRSKGWELKEIINTHSNADHIGGNAYLQENTGCRVWATRMEASIIEDPQLEPSLLWAGYPFKALKNKFLEAKPSKVTDIIKEYGRFSDMGLEAISLKGHFLDMVGIKTPDDVIFLADSVFSREIIEKYHISFLHNIQEFLETLDKLEVLDAKIFVPSHGKPTERIKDLILVNREKSLEISEAIIQACEKPLSVEDILEKICFKYDIELNPNQYVLVGSTIRSYISYLSDNNRIEYFFEKGRMLWIKS